MAKNHVNHSPLSLPSNASSQGQDLPTWSRLGVAFLLIALTTSPTLLALQSGGAGPTQEPRELDPTAPDSLQESLNQWCADCHQGSDAEAGFDVDRLFTDGDFDAPELKQELVQERIAWLLSVSEMVKAKIMPPEDAEQPGVEQRAKILRDTAQTMGRWARNADPALPAITLRRLSHNNYRRTIADLLGVRVPNSLSLPEDDAGYDFDNIGDTLTVSPVLLEDYLAAGEWVCEQVFASDESAAAFLTADPGEGRRTVGRIRRRKDRRRQLLS